jgi:hypothetical protein
MMALYHSAYEAIAKSIWASLKGGYEPACLVSLMGGSRETDNQRLNNAERHGQAGMILGFLERMPRPEQAIAWLTYGKDALPAGMKIEMASAVTPALTARFGSGAGTQKVLAMLTLRSCGYRGFGVRRVALQSGMGWKDIDSLAKRVDGVIDQLRIRVHADVEDGFRLRGWID